MSRLAPYIEIRRHPRAQLQLPVRIRWRGPIGMRLEVTQTIDVSREGLLVNRAEACELRAQVWVAFPFDSSVSMTGQPETPARVVRAEKAARGGYRVALHLELPPRDAPRPPTNERRSSPRVPFSLPIFVRVAGAPWPEESMTQDISRSGARFLTARIFARGDALLATLSWGEWAQAGEIPARVVRVMPQENPAGPAPLADPTNGLSAILTSVAVHWEKSARS
ncbi:MAG: PilZ domain-containing protein [Candidatus Acidiferrales bacterium]